MSTSPEDLIGSEMARILEGLRPGLALDLADLDGSSFEELNVSIQVMPYGDRATLAAYDLVLIDRSGEKSRTAALPKLVEATRAAAVTRSFWER